MQTVPLPRVKLKLGSDRNRCCNSVQLREQCGLSDEEISNLTPQQAINILANVRPVTKWGVTFTVLGPADPDAVCLYCKSAEPDEVGDVMNTNHGTLHEECAAAWINNQDKAR